MSRLVISYLIAAAFGRIGRFFTHWYLNGSRLYWRTSRELLAEIEKVVALRATFYHWYLPLYGDTSALGYAIGIPVRTVRIFLSAALYGVLSALLAALYLAWLLIPPILLGRILAA